MSGSVYCLPSAFAPPLTVRRSNTGGLPKAVTRLSSYKRKCEAQLAASQRRQQERAEFEIAEAQRLHDFAAAVYRSSIRRGIPDTFAAVMKRVDAAYTDMIESMRTPDGAA